MHFNAIVIAWAFRFENWISLKKLLFLLLIVSQCWATENKNWGRRILGEPSYLNKVNTGATLYHLRGLMYDHVEHGKDWWFRPTLTVTHNSLLYVYFKNTHRQDTIGFGQERLWYYKKTGKKEFASGYRYGAIYGYCIETEPKFDMYCECKKNFRADIHPMAQAFIDFSYDNLGVEIGMNPGFLNASFIIRF